MPALVLALTLIPAAIVLLRPGTNNARALILVPPTVIAAIALTDRWFRVQVALAVAVSAGIMVSTQRSPSLTAAAMLVSASVLFAAATVTRRFCATIDRRLADLRELTETDTLTGALNRRGLERRFPAFQAVAARSGATLGVAIIDIDNFARINSTFGPAHGDLVLQRSCRVVLDLIGAGSFLVRIGGEELLVIAQEPVDELAQRIRESLATNTFQPEMTVSVGLVNVPAAACPDLPTLWALVEQADNALYRAKQNGRNQVMRATPTDAGRPPTATRPPLVSPLPPDRGLSPTSWWSDRAFSPAFLARVVAGFAFAAAICFGLSLLPVGDATGWVFPTATLKVTLMAVVTVIGRQWLAARLVAWWLVILDIGVIVEVLSLPDGDMRLFALHILVWPSLMLALFLPRRVVWLQAPVIVAVCALASWLPGGRGWPSAFEETVGYSAVLITCTALVVRLRTVQEELAGELDRLALTDPLTGAGNSRRLGRLADSLESTAHTVAVVDVDGFKQLNDTHGHAHGDLVLRQVAVVLAEQSGPGAEVARLHGDQFVVLLPHPAATQLPSRVHTAVAAPEHRFELSVGLAAAADHPEADLWQLVELARAQVARARSVRSVADPAEVSPPARQR